MGFDSNLGGSPSSSSPSGKRTRDPEEEVYVDNLRSHKRYLSEIMASSLNGLTVGDSLPDNLMESPARSENAFFLRMKDETTTENFHYSFVGIKLQSLKDDMSLQYSPMSEDSDDSRFCETAVHSCSSHPDSRPSSPVSPSRYQRPHNTFPSASSTSLNASHGFPVSAVTSSQPRQRSSDSDGRFPSSPSDICHSADLRRAALLRSVQMRTHPPGSASSELPFNSGHEPAPNIDPEERPCSSYKTMVEERDYQIEECSPIGIPEPEFNHDNNPCRVLNMNQKEADSVG